MGMVISIMNVLGKENALVVVSGVAAAGYYLMKFRDDSWQGVEQFDLCSPLAARHNVLHFYNAETGELLGGVFDVRTYEHAAQLASDWADVYDAPIYGLFEVGNP